MSIAHGLDALPSRLPRSTRVTWGVFDGVHRGHRAVLEAAASWARADGAESIALTFDPHPQAFLRGIHIPLILPVSERARRMAECGIDIVVVVPFDRVFAERAPDSFVIDLLMGTLGAGGIVIGYDSTFGKGRKGTVELLRRLAGERGVDVKTVAALEGGGEGAAGIGVVKSTRLREAIASGDFVSARAMMGRPVELVGPVVRGAGRGRTIGFPTSNVDCAGLVLPPNGVYAVRGRMDDPSSPVPCPPSPLMDGVMNIGVRPTFGGGEGVTVEAHFFDPPGMDLYGKVLRVEIIGRIREERRFEGVEALREQIKDDCRQALEMLK